MLEKELTTAARRFLLLDATYGQLAPDRFAAPPRPTSRRGEWIVTDSVWETDVPHLTRLNLASKEPAPIYMHERVGQDCEHDAPEWQDCLWEEEARQLAVVPGVQKKLATGKNKKGTFGRGMHGDKAERAALAYHMVACRAEKLKNIKINEVKTLKKISCF